MLKIVSSRSESEIFSFAKKEKDKSKISSPFLDCDLEESLVFSENISIFGDLSAYLVRIGRQEQIDSLTKNMFLTLFASEHLFVLVGSGVEFEKKVAEILKSQELKIIKLEKITEKKVFDFPTQLVQALQKHDRKESWFRIVKELEKKDAEPVHGTCAYSYRTLLIYLNNTEGWDESSGITDKAWFQARTNASLGKRTKGEVVDKYFNLILAYHKARMGKLDLAKQLETWVIEN